MKCKKIISLVITMAMTISMIVMPMMAEASTEIVYDPENGWTVGADAKVQGASLILGKENSKFTPTLTSGKKYEITFDVDVPDATEGGSWSKPAQISLYAGDTTSENVMSYYLSGAWMDGLKSVTYGKPGDGTMKVTIDTEDGVWSIDAPGDGELLSGTFTAPVTDFAIGLHCEQWIDAASYPVSISNVRVEDVSKNVVYTAANGWTVNDAVEQADGSLRIDGGNSKAAVFKPVLEDGKKYSIKYDVADLAYEAGSWTYPFRVEMIAGGVATDGILAYRMANVWEARSLAVASGEGSNEIIIDTKAKTWEAYALGSLSKYGTVESFDDFTLKFYKWGGPSASISNVTVEEIPFDGTYYEQNFNQIEAAFSNWRAATVNEVRATQPLNVWSGSFANTGEDKYMLSNSMDIYPLAVTPKTSKYELNFDIKPNAATDVNGSNWDSAVMQWSLGSSNSDSWHDMKLGTSAGASVAGEVAVDKLWIFGQGMTIDPTKWINISIVYDCTAGKINAKATQGSNTVKASANFTCNASSLTGSPKVIFEGLTRNDVKYEGVYLDNVVIKDVKENVVYTEANGWTVNDAVEQADGSLMISCGHDNAAVFKPNLEADKKYSIKYNVTGIETDSSNPWRYQFLVDLMTETEEVAEAISYRQGGRWNNTGDDKLVASGTNGTNEIIIDMATGEWSTYALGNLSKSGTFADTSDFAIHFFKWGGNPPYISDVTVTEIKKNVIYTEENGWTVNGAVEQADGSLRIDGASDKAAVFKPTLEEGKKYSIKYNVSGLAVESGSWNFPFRVKMTAGGAETDGILAYRMANVWEARSLAIASGEGSNEIIVDTKNKTWEAYALGSLSTFGTVESFDDFALSFYKWTGPSASISNVTVEEIPFDGTYYEQNFNQIEAAFSNWRAATVNEVRATQPLNVWSGSFASTGEDKYMLSNSMDIYPLAVTPRTSKYELNFDIKPNAPTFANGSNWEAIVMQWSLGSTNADAWHDMKLGTSAGKDQNGEVTLDRFWVFGREMAIDPAEWINISVVYDCAEETITATATQGETSVTGTAGFVNDSASLKSSPKIIFEGLNINDVKYPGVYLNNVVVKAKGEDTAPVLSADSIKIYADDAEQLPSKASSFTNKVVVSFGQEMWADDMTDEKIYVVDKNGNKVSYESEYSGTAYTMNFADGFKAGETYTVKVEIVRNIGCVPTLQTYEKSFNVVDGVFANLVSITQGGKNITELSALSAGAAKINVNYSNSEDDTPTLHIITAYYKGGALVLAEYFDKTPDENIKTIKYELDYEVKTIEGGYDEVQFMIWDGFDSLKPLSAPITLK